jgi:hypothetical protein
VVGCGAGLLVLAGSGQRSRGLHSTGHHLLDMTILLGLTCMTGDLLMVTVVAARPPTGRLSPGQPLRVVAVQRDPHWQPVASLMPTSVGVPSEAGRHEWPPE